MHEKSLKVVIFSKWVPKYLVLRTDFGGTDTSTKRPIPIQNVGCPKRPQPPLF